LAAIPVAVHLPEITNSNSKPTALGKLSVSAQQIVAISLTGGEAAARTKPRAFVLSAVGDVVTARQWQVHLTPAKKDEKPLHVATWEIRDDKFWFQWSRFAELDEISSLLCNCGLQISVGNSVKQIALRKAQTGEKLSLNFHDETVAKWELPFSPESTRIKIECDFTFKFPRHRIVGSSILKGSGDDCWIEIIEKNVNGILLFHIESKMKSHLELRATPFVALGDKKIEYSDGVINKAIAQLETSLANVQDGIKQIEATKVKVSKKQPAVLSPTNATALKTLQTQASLINGNLAKLKNVRQFVAEQKEAIPCTARVYFEAESQLIDLLITK
jgi:hypothetical protein